MKGLAVYLLVAGAVIIVAMLLERRYQRAALRASVFCNLDSAHVNGYFEPGEQLHGASVDDVAQDMLVFATDFENMYYTEDITPHVRAWMHRKGLA